MEEAVKLIAITNPVPGMEFKTSSDLVAYCARVSNPINQSDLTTVGKLLSYCMRKKHWSIFEMVNVVIEINTTRDIARQILRHRSFHFQEFSQRYADPTKSLGFTTRETRFQDNKNRQNSISIKDTNMSIPDATEIDDKWQTLQENIINLAQSYYDYAIGNGIAKEQARTILPEGLTMSRLYMNGTLRDWIHYCHLRIAEGTQKEHQDVAKACWVILKKEFTFLENLNA